MHTSRVTPVERMTNWGHDLNYARPYSLYNTVPNEVAWLRELARYKCHLANAEKRRAAAFVMTVGDDI